jgi:serine/threonine protein kinase
VGDGQQTIGKYRILKHLATGGMGEVFLARQDGLRGFTKVVVVKRLLAQYARDPAFLEMFLNEARLAAQLHHPNIVQVFDLGEEQGQFFIAMEFVHGASLRVVKQKLSDAGRTFEPTMAAFLCAQALNGLQHAHALRDDAGQLLRLVHRDVSPDNLLVGFDGVVKVVDFGIAKASASVSTTTTGTVKGKFAYMAPEYLAGDPIDGRADVYSMGVVLYELLSGTRPFRGNSEPALIMSIMRDDPPPLRSKAPGGSACAREHRHPGPREGPLAALSVGAADGRRARALRGRSGRGWRRTRLVCRRCSARKRRGDRRQRLSSQRLRRATRR